MKTITKLKMLAISAMVVFSACQKETVFPEVETKESISLMSLEKGRNSDGWKKIEGLPQGTVFNLTYENGEILALGNNSRFQINPTTQKVQAEKFGSFSEDYSTTINRSFFTKMSKSSIFVFNTENPRQFAKLDLNKLDPEFNTFISLPGSISNAIACSKNNVFVTAYSRNSHIGRAGEAPVMLVVFSTSVSKSGNVVISEVKTIPVKGISSGARLLTVFAWEEKFIVSFDSLTLVVCQDGFFNVVSDQSIFEVVPFNGVLVGFGLDQMLVSRDEGASWNTLIRNKPANFNYWMQKGIPFGNQIISSSPNAIYQIDLKVESSELYISSIATEELGLDKEHLIYDMTRVNNMLYVATSRGIYFKSIESKSPMLAN